MAKITIAQIENQDTWNQFAQKFSPNNFLASWQWCDFNDQMGDKSLRLGVYDSGKLVGICSAFITLSKKGNFLLSPAGPLFLSYQKNYWKELLNYLIEITKAQKLKFIRIRPLIENTKQSTDLLTQMGFSSAPVRIPAEMTLILGLTKAGEEILRSMRKTTRYLIKKAQKDGVKVVKSAKLSDLEIYHELEQNTVSKHKFIPFSIKYIKNQFEIYKKTDNALIFLAKYKGQIISSAIITFFGDCAFYNHGASIDTKIPGSYAIQWAAILEAKNRGKKFYNFWGGVTDDPKDPWYGINLFKTGFGGQRYETIHAHDLPTSNLYKPIAIFEKIRYKLRGHNV